MKANHKRASVVLSMFLALAAAHCAEVDAGPEGASPEGAPQSIQQKLEDAYTLATAVDSTCALSFADPSNPKLKCWGGRDRNFSRTPTLNANQPAANEYFSIKSFEGSYTQSIVHNLTHESPQDGGECSPLAPATKTASISGVNVFDDVIISATYRTGTSMNTVVPGATVSHKIYDSGTCKYDYYNNYNKLVYGYEDWDYQWTGSLPTRQFAFYGDQQHQCSYSPNTLSCSGTNGYGQTAGGTVSAIGGSPWTSVSTGAAHTCAVNLSGKLYCWGANGYGQLGVGDTTNRSQPTQVPAPAGEEALGWNLVSAGATHTCGVTAGGRVYCWGNNAQGQIGVNTCGALLCLTHITSPWKVSLPQGGDMFASELSAGGEHTCAIASGQKLYCWGKNSNGQLGDTTSTMRTIPVLVDQSNLALADRDNWGEIRAGGQHTCARLNNTNRTLFCWGDNAYGQVGDTTSDNSSPPTKVFKPSKIFGGF